MSAVFIDISYYSKLTFLPRADIRTEIKRQQHPPLQEDVNLFWHTCWASQCQMSIHGYRRKEALQKIPSVTLFTGHLLQGLKENRRNTNQSCHGEWAHNFNRLSHHKCPAIQNNILEEMSVQGRTTENTRMTMHSIFLLAWSTWSFFCLNSCQRMAHYTIIWVGEDKWLAVAGLLSFNFVMQNWKVNVPYWLTDTLLKCTWATY